MNVLPIDRVVHLLKDILDGNVTVKVKPGCETWDQRYAGDVEFVAGKYELTVFNDCDSFDYVDSVRYEGSEANFDSIFNGLDWNRFTDEEQDRLEEIFKRAK